jgi:hypothetical protein
VIAGLTAQAFNAVGTATEGSPGWVNVAGHMAVGCASSAASGGGCRSGAVSAGIADLPSAYFGGYTTDNIVYGTMESSFVGGISSVAVGGKFWDGARNGAFGYLFNECAHTRACSGFGGYVVGYNSQDDAALAALQTANPKSVADNLEYGGLIDRNSSGGYEFTGPIRGGDAGVNPADAPIPSGTTLVGDYHTHGDYSLVDSAGRAVRTSDPARDAYNSDNFSSQDLRGISGDAVGHPGYKGYLGTPSGKFKVFDPATGQVSTFP